MSIENRKTPRKRPYHQKARARRRDEIHRRITLAAVYLHGSIGPAKTTVSDIAKRAGVRRATVYNHFPTDLELIDACSSHWFSENPPPNPAEWEAISDPALRIRTALEAMYSYYDHAQDMLEKVLRDTPQIPALEEILHRKWWPLIEQMIGVLAGDRTGAASSVPSEMADTKLEIRASLRTVLDFFTWQTLVRSGLSNEQSARLAATWIDAAGRAPK